MKLMRYARETNTSLYQICSTINEIDADIKEDTFNYEDKRIFKFYKFI